MKDSKVKTIGLYVACSLFLGGTGYLLGYVTNKCDEPQTKISEVIPDTPKQCLLPSTGLEESLEGTMKRTIKEERLCCCTKNQKNSTKYKPDICSSEEAKTFNHTIFPNRANEPGGEEYLIPYRGRKLLVVQKRNQKKGQYDGDHYVIVPGFVKKYKKKKTKFGVKLSEVCAVQEWLQDDIEKNLQCEGFKGPINFWWPRKGEF